MTHTPGPWAIEYIGDKSPKEISDEPTIAYCGDYRIRIVVAGGRGYDSHEDDIADACVIAAAPDLLAALRTFVDEYVGLVNSGDAGFWDPEGEPKVIAARKAISKAEGVPTPSNKTRHGGV